MKSGTVDRKNFPIDSIIKDCISVFQSTAAEKNVILVNRSGRNSVFADHDMVKTVVRNLIANALKFSSTGSQVEVSSENDKDRVHVIVADNGIGMSKVQLENVFNLEQKTSTVGTAGEVGTGLGLPLCKGLLLKNNGQIWIDSTPGQGTQVHFTLPANTA